MNMWKIADEEELKKYIYSNEYPILIYEKDKGGYFNKYYWKDLPKDIKDNL